MQNEDKAGDSVVVFDGPYWRAHAELAHPQAPDGRAGVIVRDMTPVERVYDPRANYGQGAWVEGAPTGSRIYEGEDAHGRNGLVSVRHLALRRRPAAGPAGAHAAAA